MNNDTLTETDSVEKKQVCVGEISLVLDFEMPMEHLDVRIQQAFIYSDKPEAQGRDPV